MALVTLRRRQWIKNPLVISAAAVFVAAGKRNGELCKTGVGNTEVDMGGRRRVLEGYSEVRLRLVLAASAGVALFAYCVWAFELPSAHGVP